MMFELLKELCEAPGVSGAEDAVREILLREIQKLPGELETRVDCLGNILVFKRGRERPKNTLLLSAHMDEVGFILHHVDEDGALRFTSVGGIDPRSVVGKTVLVGSERIPGVIGIKAIHHQSPEERRKIPDYEALFVDIGAKDKEDALAHTSLGESITFHSPLIEFGEDLLRGRALDDRAGCLLLLELLREELPVDITCAFTVQEETGCVGAKTVAYAVNPDVAIAVETTTAADIAGVPPEKRVCKLGGGPVISFMDKGTIYDLPLYQLALDTAKQEGLPVQIKEAVSGGNESRSVQTARDGAKVLAVSLPCRYLHSPSCVLSQADLHSTLNLLKSLLPEAGTL